MARLTRSTLQVILLVLVVAIVASGGCNLFGPRTGTGTVLIRVGDTARGTFQPDNLEISDYRIYGHGPSGQTPDWEFGASGSELVITDLAIGMWRFDVDAVNSAGEPIISGMKENVLVSADATTSVHILLSPISGQGELVVEFRWPSELLSSPTFEASLSLLSAGEYGDPYVLSDDEFELGEEDGMSSYTYQGTHEAGYYELATSITDESGHPGQAITFTVRILDGLLTHAVIDLETGEGVLQITINEDRQDPLAVELSAAGELVIATDETIEILSQVNGASGGYTYRWYLDGTILTAETSDSVNLGPGLEPGRYRVSLVVTDGTVLGSDWVGFDVTAAAEPASFRVDFVRAESWPWDQIFVIWAEAVMDGFMQSIYVSEKLLTGDGLTNTALPYWNMDRRQHADEDEIDAVSGASLQGSFSVEGQLRENRRQFSVYLEWDHSFDPNDWFDDQPAILYRADVDLDTPETEFPFVFVGWTPNEGTENVISDTPQGVLQSETRYITHARDDGEPDGFGPPDDRAASNMIESITLVIFQEE